MLSFTFSFVSPRRADPGLEYEDVRKMWNCPCPGRWDCTRYESLIQGKPRTRTKITHEHSVKMPGNVIAQQKNLTKCMHYRGQSNSVISEEPHWAKTHGTSTQGLHISDLHEVGVEILDIWTSDILARLVNMSPSVAKGTLQMGWRLSMLRWSLPRHIQGSQT